jgi:6-phosphogluconate dehydrogenase
MQLKMIGLGRMGSNMVRRLLKGGHECVVFNRSLPDLEPEDILIDGGNSYYIDDIRRAKELAQKR